MKDYDINEQRAEEIKAAVKAKEWSVIMSYRNEKFLSLLGKNLDNLSDDELKKIANDILDDSLHGLCFSLYEDGQGPGYEISDDQIIKKIKNTKTLYQMD